MAIHKDEFVNEVKRELLKSALFVGAVAFLLLMAGCGTAGQTKTMWSAVDQLNIKVRCPHGNPHVTKTTHHCSSSSGERHGVQIDLSASLIQISEWENGHHTGMIIWIVPDGQVFTMTTNTSFVTIRPKTR